MSLCAALGARLLHPSSTVLTAGTSTDSNHHKRPEGRKIKLILSPWYVPSRNLCWKTKWETPNPFLLLCCRGGRGTDESLWLCAGGPELFGDLGRDKMCNCSEGYLI